MILFLAFMGYETNNKYAILNASGQPILYAIEDTDPFARQFIEDSSRPFNILVIDGYGQQVLRFTREWTFCYRVKCNI